MRCSLNVRAKDLLNPHQHCLFVHPSICLSQVYHIVFVSRELTLNNTPTARTFENIQWLQDLSRSRDRHRKHCTLHIVCGLSNMNCATSDNFERFPRIVREGSWGLIHVQYIISVLPRLISHFRARYIGNVVQCLSGGLGRRRALRFVSSKTKNKSLSTHKPKRRVMLSHSGLQT